MAVVGDAWGIGGSRKRGALVERLTLAACVLALATGFAPPISAQPSETLAEARIAFDLPAQDLNAALLAFADRVGLQLVYDVGLVEGLSNAPLKGAFAPRDGLTQLLAGTGLAYRFTGADAVSIYRLDGAAAEEGGPLHTGPVMVAAALESSPADTPFRTPGSSAYISREQIERIQPSSPGDIFKEVPGVLSGASNDGTSINVNIRSAQSLNRVRTMVEGTQQESSGYQGYTGADQRTYIDPDLIGGVEISKGPGSGPYSTGTTAGTVNVRLLDADDLVPEGESFGVRLRGGLAGNGKTSQFLERPLSWRNPDTGLRERDSNDFLTDDNWFGSIAGAYRSDRFELVGAFAKRKEGNYFAGRNGPETFEFVWDRGFGDGPEPDEARFSNIEPGQEVPNTSEDTSSFLLKGALRFHDGQSLEAGYIRYDSEFGQVFPSNLRLRPPQQYALNEVESNRYWLRYKWNSRNDLIDLQANVWHTNGEELGEERQEPQENEAWGAEIWNTSFFDTGFGGLSVSYGAEYSRSEALVKGERAIGPGVRYEGPGGAFFVAETLSPAFDGYREVYGGYLNALFEPTDWLSLNAGLRYDSFKAESTSPGYLCNLDFTEREQARETGEAAVREARQRYQDFRNAAFARFQAGEITQDQWLALLDGAEGEALRDAIRAAIRARDAAVQAAEDKLFGYCGGTVVESRLDGNRFSPNVGVTVEPLQGLQLFAQYSEGFRAPSLVELGQASSGPNIVNPDLEPEVVKTTEIGVNVLRYGLFLEDDAFRTKLVYFNNDYDSYVTRTGFLNQGAEGMGASFFFYENIPNVTVSGYEASLSYDTGWAFADLNINIFDEAFDLPTQASIGQPEYSGTATLGTRWFDESLTLGGRLTFFGEPYNGDGLLQSGFGPGFIPINEQGYYWADKVIIDLFGSYRLNDAFSLGFSIENVMDKYYMPPLFVSSIPASGRTFRVNFTARF